jgi:hypothetical protein
MSAPRAELRARLLGLVGAAAEAVAVALDLAAEAVNGRPLDRTDPACFAAVRAWFAAQGWCEPEAKRAPIGGAR